MPCVPVDSSRRCTRLLADLTVKHGCLRFSQVNVVSSPTGPFGAFAGEAPGDHGDECPVQVCFGVLGKAFVVACVAAGVHAPADGALDFPTAGQHDVALFTRTGSGSTSVLSDAPLRLNTEESDGRGWRGKYCAKAREYGSPLLPVLRVDPV